MNREPLFGCDGECECGHREEDLRVFDGKVLCDYCWEDRVWPEAPNFEQAFSDLPPFKSPHLTRNQEKMSFEDYWNQYGELHASFCGGDIKMFAREFWQSAQGNGGEE